MVAVRQVMLADLDRSLSLATTGYRNVRELLDDALRIVQHRVAHVQEHGDMIAATTPSDLLAQESLVRGRIDASEMSRVPIAQLRSRFGLGDTEERLLWVLIAHELCAVTRRSLREINTEQVSDPTTDTLRRVVYGEAAVSLDAWRDLEEDRPLRRYHLIERTDGLAAAPLHRQTWKVADRVLALVYGELKLEPSLARLSCVGEPPVPVRALALAPGVARQIAHACSREGIVIAVGRAASGRRSALAAVLAERNKAVLVINGREIAKDREAARRELRLLARECVMLGLVPLLRDVDALSSSGDIADRTDLIETSFEGIVCATSTRPIARHWQRPVVQVEVPTITGAQRAVLWQRALPAFTTEQADALANLYPLAPGLIDTAGMLIRETAGDAVPSHEQLTAGMRAILDDRMAGLATRVVVTQSWTDLVLPEDQRVAIVELMARIRQRTTVYEDWGFATKVGKGLGVAALFSGPPGTGKSMAAALVAKELDIEIYQVDLSKVVSKWIGETEKNLAALFDAAEAGHAILLFDEADALFGKRTNVTSSNDRFANQEVNYLLQRLESFAGVAILTTNHANAIDEAFRRRLSVHVQFSMPEADQRAKLWRAMLPSGAPTHGDLDLGALSARFNMAGGFIRNAVLRAAFLAVSEGCPIQSTHLLRAAHLEYEAMGKISLGA